MNTIRYNAHTFMAPSLVEYEIKGEDGSRGTWFWFDGSRADARKEAKDSLPRLLERLNRGKWEHNRLEREDIRVFVDDTRIQLGGE